MQQQITASAMPSSQTFYKRALPCPPAIAFSSSEGKQLFSEALLDGKTQGFFKLIEQFRTQDEPAFCGLASLAMVLNALAIDPRRAWKGPWRWFHEQMLDCCQPLAQVLQNGIVLEQAACLARCNGATAELFRFGSFTEDGFRAMVRGICTSDLQHIIVSYSRKQFLQTGDGHFSPVGGFHAQKDMVLILDTARFKYPPHWVSLSALYKAMASLDAVTGKPRGFIRIGANPRLDSVMFTLNKPNSAWEKAKAFMDTALPQTLSSDQPPSSQDRPDLRLDELNNATVSKSGVHDTMSSSSARHAAIRLLQLVLSVMPQPSVLDMLVGRGSPTSCCSPAAPACVSPAATAAFISELHSTELYGVVQSCLTQAPDTRATEPPADLHADQAQHDRSQNHTEPTDEHTQPTDEQSHDSHPESAHIMSSIESAGPWAQDSQTDTCQNKAACVAPADPAGIGNSSGGATSNEADQATANEADQATANEDDQAVAAGVPTPELHTPSAPPCCRQSLQHPPSMNSKQTSYDITHTAEALCMFLLLVPRAVWNQVQDQQAQQGILQLLDMSAQSIVASEAEYLAAQWAELPALQDLESVNHVQARVDV